MALLYPTFLYALTAIAIPVILHLAQLRRAKRINFSNVRFIQASKDVTASQRNLKEVLILLCRICFITFLVLAFAQPFLPASESTVPTDTSQVTIAVDNSYSMQNMQDEQDISLLTAAVDQAKSVIDLFPASTSFGLLSGNNISRSGTVPASDAASKLDELDYVANANLGLQNRNNEAEHLFYFSDFQKSTFSPALLSQFDSTKQLHLIPLKADGISNITIDTVYLEDEFLRAGGDNTLHVRIYNTGVTAVEDCAVKLIIGGRQTSALSLDLPPQQATEAVLNFKFSGDISQSASIEIEDFPVEFDNVYYFTLAPSQRIEITELADRTGSPLQRLYNNESFFRLIQFNANNMDYARASSSNAIVLNGLPVISPAILSTVNSFVQAGGTVIVIPPANGDANSYKSLFQALSIPADFNNATATTAKANIAAPASDNPFFRSIFADYDPKMQMPAAVRQLSWSRASDDILKFRGGAPFLSRFNRGQGQVFLMASTLNEQYSELAGHALFVPIMYRLAIASYKQEQQLAYSLAGGTIHVPAVPSVKKEGIYKLAKDSLEFIPDQQVREDRVFFDIPAEMDEAGVYEVRLGDSTITRLAFNYDKKESFLEQYSPDELRGMLRQDQQHIHVYNYGDTFSVKGEFEKRFFGVKLWKYCLILCLFFLMAEIALIRFL
ncbi:VWA domain-containing protein [Pontibacter sp. SGAir0037]|uniref:vWA domain-containing protein n=1 Tax=Pontibacter sp. SGAir0037 TaxID=2571030 RepID=UPI0010CCF28D|nr:VWA domain-containing protein [Pontibacter sp. SGAir0037]QCR23215.1 hypothetical protein C1N53_13255 [Pontibacter sp. SGAir0037]